jgi:valyl-tRNA synthetase
MENGKASRAELPSRFDPRSFEEACYSRWLERGYFGAHASSDNDTYVIVMPPPNVTASLHMGHGLNNTIQDVLIRWRRMQGRETLWVPGYDHAGIATQNVVERQLAAEGKTRWDLGREAFVERVWRWVHETGGTILDQLKAIGSSADWDRTCFTLDSGPSKAVREVFVRLYEKGLIYRGNYIVNWCPRCATALANEEVEHANLEGKLYYQRYPLIDDESNVVVVATTRPETMLGDTAVAVHPQDHRHQHLVGKNVLLPVAEREIPVIADDFVDPEFGTGLVKVTPAHDPNDFEIGLRHDLPQVDIFNEDASLSDAVPERFRGMDRFAAREAVVKELKERGLLEKIEKHMHSVGHCYRCGTAVEPRVSEQWFVRMKPLADPALAAYRNGDVRFTPEHWGGVYEHWLENVRDWCISRQLWWGHRIPVWYCKSCDAMLVRHEDPDSCTECGGDIEQDADVLDTWFSSALWPFSTLGWPEATDDVKKFYPGHTLVTAPEILFFWVARMIMSGLEFMGEVPFRDVHLHGTVRDHMGRRMSKSLGNGIDPLEVVSRFGADALRFTLMNGLGIGADLQLNYEDLEKSFHVGRNFANKVWNASRLALPHLDGGPVADVPSREKLELSDRWILSRLNRVTRDVTENLERFRLHEVAAGIYRFFWSEFCDWYLELVKSRLYDESDAEAREVARSVVREVLDRILRLLHPVMPYITEELWQRLPNREAESIMISAWVEPRTEWDDPAAESRIAILQEMLGAVRNIRSEYNVEHSRKIAVEVHSADEGLREAIAAERDSTLKLGGIAELRLDGDVRESGAGATAVLTSGAEVHVPLEGLVDLERERARLDKQVDELQQLVERSERRLANEDFVAKAPADVVEQAREKLRGLREQLERVTEKRRSLEGE